MKSIIYIFIGSGLGGVTRYVLTKCLSAFQCFHFPLGTFVVNIMACFILGCLVGFADTRQILSAQAKLFWLVGFCGGFSTYSTFSNDALMLFQAHHTWVGLLYIIGSLAVGLAATYLGVMLVK